jgi:hypothetical protein
MEMKFEVEYSDGDMSCGHGVITVWKRRGNSLPDY